MKLRTSFFNFAVLRKNLTRFAPLWALYAVAEVLCVMVIHGDAGGKIAGDLNYTMGPVAAFHMVYALLVAACLFGDLFDSRMCNGLHAMPMRREGWLITNLVSGLIFALIPALAGGGVAAVILGEDMWVALVWQATSLLQFVFFFGVAVFSAMCAGKRLGMVAVYASINFFSILVLWVAGMIYEPLLPGVVITDDVFALLSPVVSFVNDMYMDFYFDKILGEFFRGWITGSWNYLYICAAFGVVFTLLAWLLYRKRPLETAGDFISFQPMRVFFQIVYTFAVGALVYSAGDLFGLYKDYGFLVVGILIGWFTGWMLLERRVKVFHKKALVSFAAFGILFAGSIGLTILDPAGITTYIPKVEDIQYTSLYSGHSGFYYDHGVDYAGRYITDAGEMAQVQQLHRQMLTTEEPGGEYIIIAVQYKLKNGLTVHREYEVDARSQVASDLRMFLSDERSVFAVKDWHELKETLAEAVVYLRDDGTDPVEIRDPQMLQQLVAAIEADCRAGLMAQHDYFHLRQEYIAGIEFTVPIKDADDGTIARGQYLSIYEDCVNTAAFLETLAD